MHLCQIWQFLFTRKKNPKVSTCISQFMFPHSYAVAQVLRLKLQHNFWEEKHFVLEQSESMLKELALLSYHMVLTI